MKNVLKTVTFIILVACTAALFFMRKVQLDKEAADIKAAEEAAEALEKEGVKAEVVVLRSVAPFDAEPIIASVKKTGKLVIVHEACRTGGFGAEIAATVQEKAFDYLKKPICRVAAPDVPVPFAPVLEKAYVPDYTQVLDAVHSVL